MSQPQPCKIFTRNSPQRVRYKTFILIFLSSKVAWRRTGRQIFEGLSSVVFQFGMAAGFARKLLAQMETKKWSVNISKVFQVINYYNVYTYIPMFLFNLKYSMAFYMRSHMAWLLGWIKHQQIASLGGGQVPNSNHHSLLDGTAGLTRLQVQQKTANRISWNNNAYCIYFFLGFQLSDILKPIYIIQIIIYHYLSSLKFICTHLHLRFHAASAGASTPTASFTRLERAGSLEKQQPTKNKPL